MMQNAQIIGIPDTCRPDTCRIDGNIMQGKRNVRAGNCGVPLASVLFTTLMRDNHACMRQTEMVI